MRKVRAFFARLGGVVGSRRRERELAEAAVRLLAVVGAAAWLPAWRAATVDAASALRTERRPLREPGWWLPGAAG